MSNAAVFPPSSQVLNALGVVARPLSIEELVRVTNQSSHDVKHALDLLLTGGYIVLIGGMYRRSNRDERDQWMTKADARAPP